MPHADPTLTVADARRQLAAFAADPKPLARPVLVLGGWRSPHFTAASLARRLAHVTSGNPHDVRPVSYAHRGSTSAMIADVHAALRDFGWPTVTLDVVGISLGGLIARALAHPTLSSPQISISRLFTLATPHHGATLADWIRPDPAARDLRAGSTFLTTLNTSHTPLDIRPYALHRDGWVGTHRTGVPARPTSGPISPACFPPAGLFRFGMSHFAIAHDPRILLALATALRATPTSEATSG